LQRINFAAALERFREEVLAEVEGWRRSSRQGVLDLGARVLISARMIAPSLDMLSDLRVNQWIAHLPEDHPLAQQHRSLLQATDSITWTSAHSRQLAVSNGLRILLIRGYDSLHYIKDDDLKLLSARWSKGTDALDAALCSVGVFSRTLKRGSARHGRRQRMTASELVENAGVPDRFQQVVILYLETYEARVSDVYRTLRHKATALAHFWRFIRDIHPSVKRCSEILPRHVRDYVPHAITRARVVQRGPGAGEEVRPTAHSWLVDLRVFFFDLCAWATEPDSPFKGFAPRTIPVTRHTFTGYGFEKARERTRARITATVLDLEREMPKISRLRSSAMESCARGAEGHNHARLPVVRRGGYVLGLGPPGTARAERLAH
jgi:hypothetical protein